MSPTRPIALTISALALGVLTVAPAAAATPSVERFHFHEVFVAPSLSAACGFDVVRDSTGAGVMTFYANGSLRIAQHETDIWTANGRSVVERDAFSIFVATDGSQTLSGANYHAIAPGSGPIVIDAGRLAWDADGNQTFAAGPHPVVLEGRSPTFCPALAP